VSFWIRLSRKLREIAFLSLQQVLNSPAVNVFLGTFPLLLAFVWGVISNNAALAQILQRLTRLDNRVDEMDHTFSKELHDLSELVVRIETRLVGKQVVLT
jgi:hypothetical protein